MFMGDVNKRLEIGQAGKLFRELLRTGVTTFSGHALDEMSADNITEVDVVNVIRGGKIFEQPEFMRESWRYRVHTERFCVVVAFRSETEVRVVTAWRKKS